VDDERIVLRPSFEFEDALDRCILVDPRRQAIDGLRRNGHHLSVAQSLHGLIDRDHIPYH
jgi:hypothetical protein